MKRALTFYLTLFLTVSGIFAANPLLDKLNEAQRYDLADAYKKVAEQFNSLGEEERATNYREMAEYLYPEDSAPPPAEPKQEPEVKEEDPRKILPDPAGEQASQYYFQKLLRGLFNENSGQILPVIADTLYLPLHDAGVTKDFVQSELDWFFESYDLSQLGAQDIFQLDSVSTTPLDNGYWRLDVSVYPEYSNALDLVSFWSGTMGFYFRKFPQGWRLAAIGPVN